MELSDQECKTAMINIPRTLVDREDNLQGQMGSVRSEMGVSEGTSKKC